jgi:hypothetical protein
MHLWAEVAVSWSAQARSNAYENLENLVSKDCPRHWSLDLKIADAAEESSDTTNTAFRRARRQNLARYNINSSSEWIKVNESTRKIVVLIQFECYTKKNGWVPFPSNARARIEEGSSQ